MNKFLPLLCLCLLIFGSVNAQVQNADKIAAVVSDKIVLKSEIENAFADYSRENPNLTEEDKCGILENFVSQKILVEQAERDSVTVSDDDVEGAINNRVRYFVDRFGSEEKVEEMAGKSIYQMKDEFRPKFREQFLANKVQQQIMSSVKITPQEVKAFYEKIPKDSLPFYPTTLEVGQIVFKPDINKEVDEYAYKKLEEIREKIVSGKESFDVMAAQSEDPSSRDNGGELGIVSRDDLVPEFSAVAFRLQNNEISRIVKTKYGYHIIQMMNRQGEKAKLRHILIKPLITKDMVQLAMKKADSVRADLISGKILFSAAVGKYTCDDATKITGGMFTSQQTGSAQLTQEELDPGVALAVNTLKPGEFSTPMDYTDAQTGDRLVRIIYLKSRTEPHKANLKDDYTKIQQVAFAEKQNKYLMSWLVEHIPTYYIHIDEEYKKCPSMGKFMK